MNPGKRNYQTMMPMSKSQLQETLAANSKRFSDTPNRLDESEMRQRLFQVRLKNYNPEKMRAKVRWNLIAVVMVSFFLFFGNAISQYGTKQPDVVYCDSEGYAYLDRPDGCTPCPNNGKCEGGKLVQCYENYVIKNNTCVRNEKLDLLVQKMSQRLSDIMARRRGDQICYEHPEEYGMIPLKDIRNQLSEFSRDANFESALEQFRHDLMLNIDLYPQFNREFKRHPTTGYYEDFVSSKNISFGPLCKSRLFVQDHKLPLLAFLLACLVMFGLAKRAAARRRLTIRAEEIYKRHLAMLQSEHKINRRYLLPGDSDQSAKDRDALLDEVERIRVLDEQVTLYQSDGEIYWVLV